VSGASQPYWLVKEPVDTERLAKRRDAVVEASGIGDGGLVMDLGSGSGMWLLALASRFERVVAVELDGETRTRLAQMVAGRADLRDRVTVTGGSGESLAFADSMFDAVFCKNAFQYMNHLPAAREIHRVLKPGGRFFFNCNAAGYYLLQVALGLRHGSGGKVRFGLTCFFGTLLNQATGRRIVGQRFSSIGWATRVLERAGFDIVRAEPWIDHELFPLEWKGFLTHFAVLALKR